MRWFDLKSWVGCALVLSACSDDGLPQTGDTDATASATADGGSDGTSGGSSSAVTTADSDSAGTAGSNSTDPTGLTDTSGGSGDTTGDPSGGSSTGGMTQPECMVDEDCMVVDDCCTCAAIPEGEQPPKCDILECLVSTCTSAGLDMPMARCELGSCELEPVSCDPAIVRCDVPPPKCGKGAAPRVVEGCYSGECIAVEFCDVVPSCDACGTDEACVESVTLGGPSLTCVPIPLDCAGVPTCACMGEACADPFDTCQDDIDPKNGAELTCSCAAC